MDYDEILKLNKLKIGNEYKCKFNGKLYGEEYNFSSFKVLKLNSCLSPMIDINFGDVSIFFAEPSLIKDKYDRESIINCSPFNLNETYNVNIINSFLKEIKYEA